MGGRDADQGVEAAFGFGGVVSEGAVLQARSSVADADGPAQDRIVAARVSLSLYSTLSG